MPRKRLGGGGAGGEVFIYALGPAVCLAPPGVTHFHDNASSVAAVPQGNKKRNQKRNKRRHKQRSKKRTKRRHLPEVTWLNTPKPLEALGRKIAISKKILYRNSYR